MESTLGARLSGACRFVFRRAAQVLPNSPGISARAFYQAGLVGVLLLSSPVFGLWANELATTRALDKWKQENSPANDVWIRALTGYGYRKAVLREVPPLGESREDLWISENEAWIARFPAALPDEEIQTYCLDCKTPPQRWESLGRGWAGFETLIKRLNHPARKASSGFMAARPPRPLMRDHREIVY